MVRQRRKVRVGRVVSDKMAKTVVVEVAWRQAHPLYKKAIRRLSRFVVHDPQKMCQLGDLIRIEETRPLSKTKRWRVLEVLVRGQVVELPPEEQAGREGLPTEAGASPGGPSAAAEAGALSTDLEEQTEGSEEEAGASSAEATGGQEEVPPVSQEAASAPLAGLAEEEKEGPA